MFLLCRRRFQRPRFGAQFAQALIEDCSGCAMFTPEQIKFAEKRDEMENKPGNDNTTMTEIANVLLDHGALERNALSYDAHFSGIDNGYQTQEDILSARHKENLSFQEWTAKYHQ